VGKLRRAQSLVETEMGRDIRHIEAARSRRSPVVRSRQPAVRDCRRDQRFASIHNRGLAVKARYTAEFALTSKEWGEDPGEMDYDKFAIRDLIENICALAGVDRFGRPVSEQGVVATN
jgi:hypothetical protein